MNKKMMLPVLAAVLLAACATPDTPPAAGEASAQPCRETPATGSNIVRRCADAPRPQ